MKVFVSVDMEGVSGVTDPEDVLPNGAEYQTCRRYMTGDANGAISGAYDAGGRGSPGQRLSLDHAQPAGARPGQAGEGNQGLPQAALHAPGAGRQLWGGGFRGLPLLRRNRGWRPEPHHARQGGSEHLSEWRSDWGDAPQRRAG